MKNSGERKFWKNPAVLLLLTSSLVIMLYAFLAYPVYTHMKMQVLKRAYRELCTMNMLPPDEEEQEILQSYHAEKLEFLITDEDFGLVYTNKSQLLEQQIDRYIKAHVEEYQEKPVTSVRKYSSFRVIRLRALLKRGDKNYYVSIRSEIHRVPEVIRDTVVYLVSALLLIVVIWYLLLKKRERKLAFVPLEGSGMNTSGQGSIDEAQKEFVANISHELKTPLAVISGQVEMLQCMGDEIDREYYFASIREEIDKMTEMVGNLLDITIMDHHMEEMEKSEVDLSDMMEYMVLKYDALFKKNKIKLQSTLEKNCVVFANRMYLEQAVNNYIMNAFQHTAQGKEMRIALLKKRDVSRIEVYNEGPRIPSEDLERIWQSFYMNSRGNHLKDLKLGNAGLGLYMVKKIVEQHGGACGAENQEKGVQFWMEIPLK